MNFNGLEVAVHETKDSKQWYMTVEEVAKGYGVSPITIRRHIQEHSDEIRYGNEIAAVQSMNTSSNGVTQNREITILYREGVIKLGFFIRKSERAAMFRQWATDLIVEVMDQRGFTLDDVMDRLDQQQQDNNVKFRQIETVCLGLRDEVDELKETLSMLISDSDEKLIRGLIRDVKIETGFDGRAIVGKIRSSLNVSSVYDAPHPRQVINALRNMIGKGIKLVEEDKNEPRTNC